MTNFREKKAKNKEKKKKNGEILNYSQQLSRRLFNLRAL